MLRQSERSIEAWNVLTALPCGGLTSVGPMEMITEKVKSQPEKGISMNPDWYDSEGEHEEAQPEDKSCGTSQIFDPASYTWALISGNVQAESQTQPFIWVNRLRSPNVWISSLANSVQ
jgi:hypothetical protein